MKTTPVPSLVRYGNSEQHCSSYHSYLGKGWEKKKERNEMNQERMWGIFLEEILKVGKTGSSIDRTFDRILAELQPKPEPEPGWDEESPGFCETCDGLLKTGSPHSVISCLKELAGRISRIETTLNPPLEKNPKAPAEPEKGLTLKSRLGQIGLWGIDDGWVDWNGGNSGDSNGTLIVQAVVAHIRAMELKVLAPNYDGSKRADHTTIYPAYVRAVLNALAKSIEEESGGA